jgi:hypothetical protein
MNILNKINKMDFKPLVINVIDIAGILVKLSERFATLSAAYFSCDVGYFCDAGYIIPTKSRNNNEIICGVMK